MGESTAIEWCDHTFNPWVGCTKISPGCDHCYAEGWAKRAGSPDLWQGQRRRTSAANWAQPRKWSKMAAAFDTRPRVFCSSLADVFDNQVPAEWRLDLWALIRETTHLDWLLLTKRPQNIAAMLPPFWGDGWPNVWLGTTVENQTEADRRIPHLLAVPAVVRFLSCEPLLGPVNLNAIKAPRYPDEPPDDLDIDWRFDSLLTGDTYFFDGEDGQPGDCGDGPYRDNKIDGVICGGESGPNARPMHPDWARALRDQCVAAGVPFLFKQWGEWQNGSAPSHRSHLDATVFNDGKILTDLTMEAALAEEAAHGWHSRKPTMMARVGKKAAGRLLDGRTWDQSPKGVKE